MDAFDPAEIQKAMGAFMKQVGAQQAARNVASLGSARERGPVMTSRTSELPPTPFPSDSSIRQSSATVEAAGSETVGSFCSLKVVGGDTYFGGGTMVCGDKNFFVPDLLIDLDTDSDNLIQITLSGIKCTTDDDEEIFLPGGVETASGTPAWDLKAYSPGTDFDDSDNPSSPSGTGELVVGVGRIVVKDGAASVFGTVCGNITVGQCAGILSYTRG